MLVNKSSTKHWASVNFSHFNQLLWSHWANLNQTLVEWSLDGPLPKMCPVIPTSNQDGHQAKNRKKGGWNLKKFLFLVTAAIFERRAGLSDTFLKGTHQRTIPARLSVIWFSGFRGEDLNVTFYQSSLTYILGFSVRFFQPVYSV
jgi:hypothetical protein